MALNNPGGGTRKDLRSMLRQKSKSVILGAKVTTFTSRLKAFREPVKPPAELLERHPGDPMTLIKFREVESLRERASSVPAGITLAELQALAASFFDYPADRVAEVRLSYPEEGIQTFDQDGESPLLELASDGDWRRAQAHWGGGVGARRNGTLVRLTHGAFRDVTTPQKAADVLEGARLIFHATAVPANLASLERLGELGAVERAPCVLLRWAPAPRRASRRRQPTLLAAVATSFCQPLFCPAAHWRFKP